MKKTKRKAYPIFTLITCLFAIVSAVFISFFAIDRTTRSNNYPKYDYAQYKDCSLSKTFNEEEGAQLYEVEDLLLSDGVKIISNASASNKEVVTSFKNGETITLEVESDVSTMAMFTLCCSYLSESGKAIEASSLFDITLNNIPLTNLASIDANYNNYDFSENDLTAVHLSFGKNTFIITSKGDFLSLDYLLLRGRITSVSNSVIGNKEIIYRHDERRQFLSTSRSELKGPIIIDDEQASEKHSAFFSNPYDQLTYYIKADKDYKTSASLRLRLARDNIYPSFEVRLNDQLISLEGQTFFTFYYDISLPKLELNKDNIFSIKNISGSFYVDGLILNSDINYSPYASNQRYEAEEASLYNGGEISRSNQASNHYVVSSNLIDSYVEFNISSMVDDNCDLVLTYSYDGHSQRSDMVFGLSLNGKGIDTSSYILNNTNGYNHYQSVYLGSISLKAGDNKLCFYSYSGNYNLDCIDLFKNNSNLPLSFQAEEMILRDGNYASYMKGAEGEKAVCNNLSSSSLTYSFYISNEKDVELSLKYANPYSDVLLMDCFSLYHNQDEVDLNPIVLPSTKRPSSYISLVIANIHLQSGLNQIKLISKGNTLLLDSFKIQEKTI